jgi:hypothetical protein
MRARISGTVLGTQASTYTDKDGRPQAGTDVFLAPEPGEFYPARVALGREVPVPADGAEVEYVIITKYAMAVEVVPAQRHAAV